MLLRSQHSGHNAEERGGTSSVRKLFRPVNERVCTCMHRQKRFEDMAMIVADFFFGADQKYAPRFTLS